MGDKNLQTMLQINDELGLLVSLLKAQEVGDLTYSQAISLTKRMKELIRSVARKTSGRHVPKNRPRRNLSKRRPSIPRWGWHETLWTYTVRERDIERGLTNEQIAFRAGIRKGAGK